MCVSNRTAGKTTFYNKLVFGRAIKSHAQFMLVFRKCYDLSDVAMSFWDTIRKFFPGWEVTEQSHKRGVIKSIWAKCGENDPILAGWAVSLSTIEVLKRSSALFSHVESMIFDEFILEKDSYLDDELNSLISLHTSVARGYGEMVRRVELIMMGNPFTMLNPYYTHFGIPDRLKADTTYLRGHGWVFEQSVNVDSLTAQQTSSFNRAFAGQRYTAYAAEGIYFNDNLALVGKLKGRMRYICTLVSGEYEYGVMESYRYRCIYVTDKADSSYPMRIACKADDITPTTFLFTQNNFMVTSLREAFRNGNMRFKNLDCKKAFMAAVKY